MVTHQTLQTNVKCLLDTGWNDNISCFLPPSPFLSYNPIEQVTWRRSCRLGYPGNSCQAKKESKHECRDAMFLFLPFYLVISKLNKINCCFSFGRTHLVSTVLNVELSAKMYDGGWIKPDLCDLSEKSVFHLHSSASLSSFSWKFAHCNYKGTLSGNR